MGRCVDLAPSITHSHSLLTHNCTVTAHTPSEAASSNPITLSLADLVPVVCVQALLSVLGCSKGPLPPTLATRLMPPLLQHHINTHVRPTHTDELSLSCVAWVYLMMALCVVCDVYRRRRAARCVLSWT
jgi:hypothetical protein